MGTEQRPTKFTPERKRVFLQTLADGWSVTRAAAAADINKVTAYQHRASDPEFAAAWERAYDSGTDKLEDALQKRAEDDERRDTTALIFSLKGRRPERWRERLQIDYTKATEEQIREGIAKLSDEDLAAEISRRRGR